MTVGFAHRTLFHQCGGDYGQMVSKMKEECVALTPAVKSECTRLQTLTREVTRLALGYNTDADPYKYHQELNNQEQVIQCNYSVINTKAQALLQWLRQEATYFKDRPPLLPNQLAVLFEMTKEKREEPNQLLAKIQKESAEIHDDFLKEKKMLNNLHNLAMEELGIARSKAQAPPSFMTSLMAAVFPKTTLSVARAPSEPNSEAHRQFSSTVRAPNLAIFALGRSLQNMQNRLCEVEKSYETNNHRLIKSIRVLNFLLEGKNLTRTVIPNFIQLGTEIQRSRLKRRSAAGIPSTASTANVASSAQNSNDPLDIMIDIYGNLAIFLFDFRNILDQEKKDIDQAENLSKEQLCPSVLETLHGLRIATVALKGFQDLVQRSVNHWNERNEKISEIEKLLEQLKAKIDYTEYQNDQDGTSWLPSSMQWWIGLPGQYPRFQRLYDEWQAAQSPSRTNQSTRQTAPRGTPADFDDCGGELSPR